MWGNHGWDPKNIDWAKIQNSNKEQCWNEIIKSSSIDFCADKLIEIIQGIIKDATIIVKRTAKTTKLKPWISAGLIKSIRNRDKLSKQLKKEPYNINLRDRYTRYRNLLH